MLNKKIKVARLSIISNSLLITLKVIVGIITGSVSIISEAIHSSVDLLASIIAFFSVKNSSKPADDKHPYGHGKYENISGVIEALLIFVAAIFIFVEAIHKIIDKTTNVEIAGLGALIMFISATVNIIVARKLYRIAKETDSIALEADALHLKADVLTSLGVGVSLLLLWITDWHIIDPIAAILVAIFIIKEAYSLTTKALNPLLDTAWDKEDIIKLIDLLKKNNVKFHELKTRKSGHCRFVEFHCEFDGNKSLKDAHSRTEEIEEFISTEFKNIHTTIHEEPI